MVNWIFNRHDCFNEIWIYGHHILLSSWNQWLNTLYRTTLHALFALLSHTKSTVVPVIGYALCLHSKLSFLFFHWWHPMTSLQVWPKYESQSVLNNSLIFNCLFRNTKVVCDVNMAYTCFNHSHCSITTILA